MPYLIKKIDGEFLDYLEGNAQMVGKLVGGIGTGDYISVNTFTAFVQDFTYVVEAIEFPLLETFGLKNNTQFVELKISY